MDAKCGKNVIQTLAETNDVPLMFVYLLQGSAGHRKCCLTAVSHGGWAGGLVRPVGESASGLLMSFALTRLQTLSGRGNSQARGLGLHLGEEISYCVKLKTHSP